jgi:signal peptidase
VEIETSPRSRRRYGRVLTNAVYILVSLVALAFIVPAAFGLERYVIAGGSMTGSISRGSVVLEEVVPVTELREGDVITYVPPADAGIDNLVTHRIVEIDGQTFRTKGDANPKADPWTFELTAATQPRVVLDVPFVGYPLLMLQDRNTRMLVIGGPAVVVALLSLRELLRGLRRRPAASEPAEVSEVVATAGPVPAQRRTGASASAPARTVPTAPVHPETVEA